MSESDNPEGQKKKVSIKQFIYQVANPYELLTEGLGLIFCHYLTMENWREFLKRQKNIDNSTDLDLVKMYFGCVSGVRDNEDEKLPGPLSLDQVGKLTNNDVVLFSKSYLTNIVKAEIKDDPVRQMADYIRDEKKTHDESFRKLNESFNTLRIAQTSELMKGWKTLSEGVNGSMTALNEQLESVFKPSALTRSAIGDALKKLSEDHIVPIAKLDKSIVETLSTMPTFPVGYGQIADDYNRLKVPLPEDTFNGRTTFAVENLVEASEVVKDNIGIIVIQAGRVSNDLNKVAEDLTKVSGHIEKVAGDISTIPELIKNEAKSSQVFAKRALFVAAVSFVVSALALVGSFYYADKSYSADRTDARSSNADANQIIRELKTQNELLRKIEKQKQPSIPTKPKASVPIQTPISTPKKKALAVPDK